LLRLWVRIPPGSWMSLCCECCVSSGRGLCDELITLAEESYWLWCVVVCDLETSWMRRPWPSGVCRAKYKQNKGKDYRLWYSGYVIVLLSLSCCKKETVAVRFIRGGFHPSTFRKPTKMENRPQNKSPWKPESTPKENETIQ